MHPAPQGPVARSRVLMYWVAFVLAVGTAALLWSRIGPLLALVAAVVGFYVACYILILAASFVLPSERRAYQGYVSERLAPSPSTVRVPRGDPGFILARCEAIHTLSGGAYWEGFGSDANLTFDSVGLWRTHYRDSQIEHWWFETDLDRIGSIVGLVASGACVLGIRVGPAGMAADIYVQPENQTEWERRLGVNRQVEDAPAD